MSAPRPQQSRSPFLTMPARIVQVLETVYTPQTLDDLARQLGIHRRATLEDLLPHMVQRQLIQQVDADRYACLRWRPASPLDEEQTRHRQWTRIVQQSRRRGLRGEAAQRWLARQRVLLRQQDAQKGTHV